MRTMRAWHFPWHWLWILLAVLALMLLLPAPAHNASAEGERAVLTSHLMVEDRVMSREQPNGCERPAPERFFFIGDAYAYLWMRVEGVRKGDRVTVSWIRPSGLVHRTDRWDPLLDNGEQCLAASLPIAGDVPAKEPGRWLARAEWNEAFLFEHEFAVLDPSRPMITE